MAKKIEFYDCGWLVDPQTPVPTKQGIKNIKKVLRKGANPRNLKTVRELLNDEKKSFFFSGGRLNEKREDDISHCLRPPFVSVCCVDDVRWFIVSEIGGGYFKGRELELDDDGIYRCRSGQLDYVYGEKYISLTQSGVPEITGITNIGDAILI